MLSTLLPDRQIQIENGGTFLAKFNENCFDITLTVVDDGKNNKRISLDVSPEEQGGYELVVSFVVGINGVENWVDCDLWKSAEAVWEAEVNVVVLTLGFRLEVHDVLAPRDLQTSGGYRSLRVLSVRGEYFVNATELKELGGSLFNDWHRRECENESAVVATDLHEDQLDALLKSCCAYSTIVITKRNFELLLPIAWKYKITGVLRAIERYILNAKGIHPIYKLDFAHKYKFAMLATEVLKSLGGPTQRKESLVAYMQTRGLASYPHHLLELLDLSP